MGENGGTGFWNTGDNQYGAVFKIWYSGNTISRAYVYCANPATGFISTGNRNQFDVVDDQDNCGHGADLEGAENAFHGLPGRWKWKIQVDRKGERGEQHIHSHVL